MCAGEMCCSFLFKLALRCTFVRSIVLSGLELFIVRSQIRSETATDRGLKQLPGDVHFTRRVWLGRIGWRCVQFFFY